MTATKVMGYPDRGQVWVWCCTAEAEADCRCACHFPDEASASTDVSSRGDD